MKQFQKTERKKKEKSQPKKMQPKTKHIQSDLIGIDPFEYRTRKRKKTHSLSQYKDYLINARDTKFGQITP